MDGAKQFAKKVRTYFERIGDEVFADDPASNRQLHVEVLGEAMAGDTPVLILIAPWTLCGLATPPDGRFPSTLRVGPRHYPALANEVEEVGPYWSVVLIPDVSGFPSQDNARSEAQALAEKFRTAVTVSRAELTEVSNAERRALFKKSGGGTEIVAQDGTPFGSPDGSL